jgi:hypothetical protein
MTLEDLTELGLNMENGIDDLPPSMAAKLKS